MTNMDSQVLRFSNNGINERLESVELRRRFGLRSDHINEEAIERSIEDLLYAIGEDTQRSGLLDTPKRVARSYQELVSGYTTDPVALLNNALFDIASDDMVIVSDIDYYSLCEHHLLPFVGRADVAYIPNGKIIGVSKIPRVIDMFARRLQVQERLTRQIAEFLAEVLQPKGVAVVMTGRHMCSVMRGVKKHQSNMVTSTMLGDFHDCAATRNEFLLHVRGAKNL